MKPGNFVCIASVLIAGISGAQAATTTLVVWPFDNLPTGWPIQAIVWLAGLVQAGMHNSPPERFRAPICWTFECPLKFEASI